MADDWEGRLGALGAAIRQQRQLAKMSLRQLSDLAQVSNPYLSQIERGLHEPSVRVVRSIARALNVSAEELLDRAGMLDEDEQPSGDTEDAIRRDARLTDAQKDALITVYRSFLPTAQ
ncbi:MAG: helix-turn-helix domain-containing protein [Actinomycetota bacterium]|jgi:transcriptional regulator with XRE-family HTH domain